LAVYLRDGRLQPHPTTEIAWGTSMTTSDRPEQSHRPEANLCPETNSQIRRQQIRKLKESRRFSAACLSCSLSRGSDTILLSALAVNRTEECA
jgi:hypothetical protein